MSRKECHNDLCGVQHMSNMSLSIQYGDEMKPTPCTCECHLDEQNIHGEAARKFRTNPEICNKCQKQIIPNPNRLYKEMCNDCGVSILLNGGSIKADELL